LCCAVNVIKKSQKGKKSINYIVFHGKTREEGEDFAKIVLLRRTRKIRMVDDLFFSFLVQYWPFL